MKRWFLSYFLLLGVIISLYASSDVVFIKETQVPFLIERTDNVLFYLRIDVEKDRMLNHVTIKLEDSVALSEIKALKLYYGGVESKDGIKQNRVAPVNYLNVLGANLSYSVKKDEVRPLSEVTMLHGNQKLYPGRHYFWVSLEMHENASIFTKIKAGIRSVVVDGVSANLSWVSPKDIEHRLAVGVRHAGDDGVAAYRIPGLVTTDKGTLLGVYDVRHNSSVDLQEHIDVGLSRSTDGGRTWEKMRIPICLGEEGGLPAAQNGVGDPSILVDTKTNTVWIAALWTHGMGNRRAWVSSGQGMSKYETGQLILTKSTDDGKTWSAPINITEQVKHPEWYLFLQGPGRGITMGDGTLVFPVQFIDENRIPNAGIMYSKDRGETWTFHNYARTNTTEAQVVEISPGILMLNMRDNRGGSRAVATTSDLGKTWVEHPSSRKALREPVCMASLIHVAAKDNILGKDLLIFSNPDDSKKRKNLTIKLSLDGGNTWLPEHQLLLDEEEGWGYSCLTMIDRETVGILYESSVAHMTFQAVKLTELIK